MSVYQGPDKRYSDSDVIRSFVRTHLIIILITQFMAIKVY